MPREYVYIGSSPCDEDCAQVGSPRYHELSKLELEQFKAAIIQKCGQPPGGVSLVIHDGEVCAVFNSAVADEKAQEWAWNLETEAPATWEEAGMKAPRLDDDAFAATELIPVPEGVRAAAMNPTKCDLAGTQYASLRCLLRIGNEFVDGSVPAVGSWANVCPACFGGNKMRLGEGLGQRYRKATDGKWYCVEGGRKNRE